MFRRISRISGVVVIGLLLIAVGSFATLTYQSLTAPDPPIAVTLKVDKNLLDPPIQKQSIDSFRKIFLEFDDNSVVVYTIPVTQIGSMLVHYMYNGRDTNVWHSRKPVIKSIMVVSPNFYDLSPDSGSFHMITWDTCDLFWKAPRRGKDI